MSKFLEALSERVLLCDGAMGSRIQALDLETDKDYWGNENCSEILNLSRPDVILDVHKGYYAAGADLVETNSFGGSPVTLGEFDLEDRAHEINKRAAELAREAAESFKGDGRELFVAGSIGPGTKLPSLGHIGYDDIEAGLIVQCAGLIEGGVDTLLIETCQDPLQIKAAVNAAKAARALAGKDDLPIMVQVTVETTGTLLVGTDIAAAATIIDALDVPVIGLNCATGPQEMAPHVQWLAENWPGMISLQPNAGLPELVEGKTHYPLTPGELAKWLERFLSEDGINMIGGCCGTTTDHIAALDAMLRELGGAKTRPAPRERNSVWVPGIASLYGPVAYRQENAYLSIGERCNANGSRKFRKFQEEGDWDACIAMGVEQVKEGSHGIDVCTAFVGRDEVAEMTEVLTRMRGSVNAPMVIDSTELNVLEAAMKLYGGKPVLNSINFEDGEEPAAKRLELARKFGSAVIALTIDEEGMAKEADHKVEVARRLYDFACNKHGLPPQDLIFDPLTFTICTGNEDDRKLGLWTLEAIEIIARELPDCQVILGLSNISFGLNPAARHVLNSVFLDHAIRRGLTGAIVHLSKIMPLHKIAPREVEVAEDLIFDRRREGYDPLHEFIALFEGRKAEASAKRERAEDVETRLKERIVDGDRQGLAEDLDEALGKYPALDIVNTHLLDGMKVVGELFGAGKMQLPFVLQSAETMKAAVAHLEPHMEKVEGQEKGTVVLATVKGDVHDIGKNLVDIVLSNNGFEVVNLGIRVPSENLIQAVEEHRPDVLGLSGLLVKSAQQMVLSAQDMELAGIDVPLLVGGAALSKRFTHLKIAPAYKSLCTYARDAMDGLALVERLTDPEKRPALEEEVKATMAATAAAAADKPAPVEEAGTERSDTVRIDVDVPAPPDLERHVEELDLDEVWAEINPQMLYGKHLGLKGSIARRVKEGDSKLAHLEEIVGELKEFARGEMKARAVWRFFPASSEGNRIELSNGTSSVAGWEFPRQRGAQGLCISDYVLEGDHVALFVTTAGGGVRERVEQWKEEGRYLKSHTYAALAIETAEAAAELLHRRLRERWGFADPAETTLRDRLSARYRGKRFSFGYPACPDLTGQRQLFAALAPEEIGVALTDGDMMDPEASVSALVVHHPDARYFGV